MDIKKAQFRIEHLTAAHRDRVSISLYGTANMEINFEIKKKTHEILLQEKQYFVSS